LHVLPGSGVYYGVATGWSQFFNVAEDNKVSGIADILADGGVSIYPNPVQESFRIEGLTENTPVTVWDTNGRIVLQQTVYPGETVMAGHLQKGIYFVNVKGRTVKVIKN
jgi:hypothetical protein